MMLLGGADISGTERSGPDNHAALIIGKEESINRIHNAIGIEQIHMSRLRAKKRTQVL